MLNGPRRSRLQRCVSFVEHVFAVPYRASGRRWAIRSRPCVGVPRDWDYVLHHPAAIDRTTSVRGLRRYYAASRASLPCPGVRRRRRRGAARIRPSPGTCDSSLPEDARALSASALSGPRGIAVMPAGSRCSVHLYPSATSWIRILDEVGVVCRPVFVFVGRITTEGGRTVSGISREVSRFASRRPGRTRSMCSTGRSSSSSPPSRPAALFVSPHTGFGFAALAVDTPWLTLSGGDWHEYFFNGVPFYSVLPKSPTVSGVRPAADSCPMIEADEDGEGPRTATDGRRAGSARTSTSSPRRQSISSKAGSRTRSARRLFPRLLEATRRPSADPHVRGPPPRVPLSLVD